MFDLGIIEESDSPYCSPVVLVKKSSDKWRLCIDFRAVNDVTIFDAEPMPLIDDSLGDFVGDTYFTELDLCSGYFQIPLTEDSRKVTAFATHRGLMQFTVMPFGLKCACATFVRLMRKVTKNLVNTACYFDNLVVHNSNWDEHLRDVRSLCNELRAFGLTAGPSKCHFGHESIKYLGFSLGNNHLSPQDEKVKAILDMFVPATKKQLRSFIGTVSFYRRFIPNFSDLVKPLNIHLKKFSSNKLSWTNDQLSSFQTLKNSLADQPILCLPDFSKMFYVRTDASDSGLGAVLLQDVDDLLKPVAYASRCLLDREQRYATVERECLGIIWAIGKFQYYLFGREFVLQTDQQALTYLKTMNNSNGRLMRWALSLQDYSFRVDYIKGSMNVGADLLSRCSGEASSNVF